MATVGPASTLEDLVIFDGRTAVFLQVASELILRTTLPKKRYIEYEIWRELLLGLVLDDEQV